MAAIYFRTFETTDRTIAVACGSHSLRLKFAEVLGIEDLGLVETSLQEPHWEAYYAELKQQVEDMMRQTSAETWIARLNEAGIPVAAVRFPIELFDDPHAHANQIFHDMEHPAAGTVRMLGPPVELDGEGFQPSAPTPAFGSEADRILHDLGFDAPAIEALVEKGIVRREL
jgi:crotonobetainyl-CoA:carnitine CoA-transferase CaiB-like acyl-CoA transferase